MAWEGHHQQQREDQREQPHHVDREDVHHEGGLFTRRRAVLNGIVKVDQAEHHDEETNLDDDVPASSVGAQTRPCINQEDPIHDRQAVDKI